MKRQKVTPIEKIITPIRKFITNGKSGGIVLASSAVLALIIANSPFREYYFELLEKRISININSNAFLDLSIHQWINDGLMAIFFFVIGLELKREIIAGELSKPKDAILPIIAAIGGMAVPALIFFLLNPSGEASNGWGIPMATDIAFALGVLYLLGDKVPLSLKVFLTAVAIVDDLGAVLVIALFYTTEISLLTLGAGVVFILLMFLGNKLGIRNSLFFALLGIGGAWTLFLLSGVHATIAAVLAAFMIPTHVKINEEVFSARVKKHLNQFQKATPNDLPTITSEQLHILERLSIDTRKALTPLQRLEHIMHPIVTFFVIPIFALANAGITFVDTKLDMLLENNIAIGVALGLLLGKVIGITGFTWISVKLRIANLPKGMSLKNLLGLAFLASIGFTMSLFITQLAYDTELYRMQAKIGIFTASIIGGITGYFMLNKKTKAK